MSSTPEQMIFFTPLLSASALHSLAFLTADTLLIQLPMPPWMGSGG